MGTDKVPFINILNKLNKKTLTNFIRIEYNENIKIARIKGEIIMKENKNENRIITELPRYEEGTYKGKINHLAMMGMELEVLYEGEIYTGVKILEYVKGSCSKFVVEYNERVSYIRCCHFIKGNFGGILGVRNRTKDFKVNVGDVFKDDKRDLTIVGREYKKGKKGKSRKGYRYTCNMCGYEGLIEEGHLLRGQGGCSCCAGKTVVEGINSIWDTDRWLCDLGVSEEDAKTHTRSSSKKVIATCPRCGRTKSVKINRIYTHKSIGCICGDGFSYGHKYIYNTLKQNNIDFQCNVTFDWCKFKDYKEDKMRSGEYDFVLESIKIIIEIDGGFHREYNAMNGQTKEESQYIDEMKDKLAKEHGYEVIRIYYDDNNHEIKKYILESDIINIVDVSNTDWLKCEEFALSNLVKEICQYWDNRREGETTATLAEVFGLSRVTITDYLKKGAGLGWCEYDAKEEMIKNGKLNSKRVAMYKDGVFIMQECSVNELVRRVFSEMEIKISVGKVSAVCRGKQKHHKGYTFKYIIEF